MAYKQLLKLGYEEVAKHEATYQEDSMRGFIDIYLKQIYECSSKPEPSSFKGKVTNSIFAKY